MEWKNGFVGIDIQGVRPADPLESVISADEANPAGQAEHICRPPASQAKEWIYLDSDGPGEEAGDARHDPVPAPKVQEQAKARQPYLSEKVEDMRGPGSRPRPQGGEAIGTGKLFVGGTVEVSIIPNHRSNGWFDGNARFLPSNGRRFGKHGGRVPDGGTGVGPRTFSGKSPRIHHGATHPICISSPESPELFHAHARIS